MSDEQESRKEGGEWRLAGNRQRAKGEGREGPTTNSPRDTLPRIGYRQYQVRT
jgi:hypothetical protein